MTASNKDVGIVTATTHCISTDEQRPLLIFLFMWEGFLSLQDALCADFEFEVGQQAMKPG